MNEPPKSTKKVLAFAKWLLKNKADKIDKKVFESMIMIFFGANHQTLSNYKKLCFSTDIVTIDPENGSIIVINKEAIEKWIRNLQSFFPEWEV